MKRIYRIECAKGYGPYRGDITVYGCLSMDTTRHPTPTRDSGLADAWCKLRSTGEGNQYVFGFASFTQFRAWFYNDAAIRSMYAKGLRVSVYEVVDLACHIGNTQVIFHRTYHTPTDKVYELSLEEALKPVDSPENTDYITTSHTINWTRRI